MALNKAHSQESPLYVSGLVMWLALTNGTWALVKYAEAW